MSTVSKPVPAPKPAPAPARNPLRLRLPEDVTPTVPVRTAPWRKLPWVLGIAIVTVSLVGAGHVLQSKTNEGPPSSARDAKAAPQSGATGAVFLGSVDVEGSIRHLAPSQMGEVVELAVQEGQTVKEGDLILKVSEEPTHIAIKQAEAGVTAAQALVDTAKQGIEQLRHGLTEQQAAIDAARSNVSAAESRYKKLEALRTENLTNENDMNAARQLINAAKADLSAQEAKYRRIQAQEPETKVREAMAGLDVAKKRLDGFKYQLEKCGLRAPCDGTILRLNVAKGVLISPQMRQAPVLLCPNGPRIVRTEMIQEYAQRVHPGMDAVVQDETNASITWTGKVKRVAEAYLPKRTQSETISIGGNDAMQLECVVEIAPSQNPPRVGQRVRVAIGPRP